MRQLILGGARSGKSMLAERLADRSGQQVVYLATADGMDAEMRARILAHQRRRPAAWRTVEEPIRLAGVLEQEAGPDTFVLVDCLTLWLSNLILQPDQDVLIRERDALLNTVERLSGSLVMVSNEVGMGIVPMGEISRRFQDQAGWLHQALAERFDRVILTVAGLPQILKGPPL